MDWVHAPPLTVAPAIRAVRLTAARVVMYAAGRKEEIFC